MSNKLGMKNKILSFFHDLLIKKFLFPIFIIVIRQNPQIAI